MPIRKPTPKPGGVMFKGRGRGARVVKNRWGKVIPLDAKGRPTQTWDGKPIVR